VKSVLQMFSEAEWVELDGDRAREIVEGAGGRLCLEAT